MKILLLSNLFPPFYIGGYELAAFEVVKKLRKRGHQVEVLTSNFGVGGEDGGIDHVHRILDFTNYSDEGTFAHFCGHYLWSQKNFSRSVKLIEQVKPEIVFSWNLGGISLSPTVAADALSVPVLYYVSDYWMLRKFRLGFPVMENFAEDLVDKGLNSFLNRRVPLKNLIYTSEYVKNRYSSEGITAQREEVIHHGVDVERFCRPRISKNGGDTKILYVGQITEQKGLHHALRAFARLMKKDRRAAVRFNIVGSLRNDRGSSSDYAKYLFKILKDEKIGDRVNFLGKIPRAQIPQVYQNHDILVFPSIWEEPFSITLLEAMASELAVVATTTGGTSEVLIDRENGLAVASENVGDLSEAMEELTLDRRRRAQLGGRAGKIIREGYTLDIMVDRIEEFLKRI